MKVQNFETVSLSEKSGAGKLLANLAQGSMVNARIAKRLTGGDVILNINGNEVRAHFQKGIPPGDRVALVLNERKNGLLFFSLKGAAELLKPFLLTNKPVLSPALVKYLGAAPNSIFELNRIAFFGADILGKGLTAVFNSLAQKYGNPPWLLTLASILSDSAIGWPLSEFIHSISDFSGKQQKHDHRKKQKTDEDVQLIAGEIDNNITEAGMNELLSGTIAILSAESDGCFEIPFFDGEKYIPLNCLLHGEAWMFQADFSHAGKIEILAKKNSKIVIDIFVENKETLEIMQEHKNKIAADLTNITLNLHNFKKSIANLLVINDTLSYSVWLDIKV